jgi:hypothetical protein
MNTYRNRRIRQGFRRLFGLQPRYAQICLNPNDPTTIYDPSIPGNVFVQEQQANGMGKPTSVRGPAGNSVQLALATWVELQMTTDNRLAIVNYNVPANNSAGVNVLSSNTPQIQSGGYVGQQSIITALLAPQAIPDLTVTIKSWASIVAGIYYEFPGTDTGGLDLSSYVPSSGNNLYALVFINSDFATVSVATSTPRATADLPLGSADIQEALTAGLTAEPGATPIAVVRLYGDQTTIIQSDIVQDVRQLINNTQASGTGNVVGPASSTDNAAARFDGATGQVIQNSGVIIDDSNNITIPGVETTQSGKVRKIRVVTAAGAVTITASDDIVSINKGTGAATVANLPSSPVTGQTFVVHDGKGDSATNNITITPAAGNINGAGTLVLNIAYASAICTYNGTQWDATIAETGSTGGITQLTGDVTAGPGSGSQAATLATVNTDVGSFTLASITVNAKGLITAAATGLVNLATQVSGLLGLAHGGTGADLSATGPGVLVQASAAAVVTVPAALSIGYLADAFKLPVSAVQDSNINISNPGTSTFDGVGLSSGQRLLLTGQSTGSQNGIWVFNGSSSALTRSVDYASGSTIQAFYGLIVHVIQGGTTYGGAFMRTTTTGTITIDTTATAWVQTRINVSVVSGTLPTVNLPVVDVAHGGTGQNSLAAHDLIVGNNTSAVNVLAPGTARNVAISDGTDWTSRALVDADIPDTLTIGNGSTIAIKDGANFKIENASDVSKIAEFDASGITTSTTRVYAFPDVSDTLVNEAELDILLFGDGSDGAYSASSGTTVLTRDMYYSSMTPTGTAKIAIGCFRIFCNGNCDLSNAGAGFLSLNGGDGGNGGAAAAGGGAAGSAGGAPTGQTLGTGTDGLAGAQGVLNNIAGANGTNGNSNTGNGGAGGAGGGGGDGSGTGVGGTGGGASSITASLSFRRAATELLRGATLLGGGASGGSGGSGGSASAGGARSGGGGGSGSGAGVVGLFAKTITRGGSTAASAIRSIGGNGGNGGDGGGSGVGGGGAGGGGGGGGGWIYIVYRQLAGTSATNALDASGGNGGNGGAAGVAGNAAGVGANGGAGGRITLINVLAGTSAETTGSAGSAGSGATGGAGNSFKANL